MKNTYVIKERMSVIKAVNRVAQAGYTIKTVQVRWYESAIDVFGPLSTAGDVKMKENYSSFAEMFKNHMENMVARKVYIVNDMVVVDADFRDDNTSAINIEEEIPW